MTTGCVVRFWPAPSRYSACQNRFETTRCVAWNCYWLVARAPRVETSKVEKRSRPALADVDSGGDALWYIGTAQNSVVA